MFLKAGPTWRTFARIYALLNVGSEQTHAEGVMNLMAAALGLAMVAQSERPQLNVVLCDQVGLHDRILHLTTTHASRIFARAGVDLVWLELERGSRECKAPPVDNHVTVIIARRAPKGWTSSDVLGMAPAGTNRAYIFHDLAARFMQSANRLGSGGSEMGVLLGHAIAHELGHILMPGISHGQGVMTANWSFKEWHRASDGTLLFNPDHATIIRKTTSRRTNNLSALAQ
jgi:hypothetical protein